jgi:hypothetical protein
MFLMQYLLPLPAPAPPRPLRWPTLRPPPGLPALPALPML